MYNFTQLCTFHLHEDKRLSLIREQCIKSKAGFKFQMSQNLEPRHNTWELFTSLKQYVSPIAKSQGKTRPNINTKPCKNVFGAECKSQDTENILKRRVFHRKACFVCTIMQENGFLATQKSMTTSKIRLCFVVTKSKALHFGALGNTQKAPLEVFHG